ILVCAASALAEPKTQDTAPSNWMSYLNPSYWISGRSRPSEARRLRYNVLRRRLEENNDRVRYRGHPRRQQPPRDEK
ncbi:Hypothetical protein FKW44_023187, partial [Caligus rogercresseyi]